MDLGDVERMVSTGLKRVSFLLLIPEGVFPVVPPLTGRGLGVVTIPKGTKMF